MQISSEAAHKIAVQAAVEAARLVLPSKEEMQELVSDSVKKTLIELGIAAADPIETQKDMVHLRAWREAMEEVRRKGVTTLVGICVAGLLGALWLGLKDVIHH
jgi:hypothetical protein